MRSPSLVPFSSLKVGLARILPLLGCFPGFLREIPHSSIAFPRALCPSLSWKCFSVSSHQSASLAPFYEERQSSCLSLFWAIFAGSSSFPGFASPGDRYSMRAHSPSVRWQGSNLSLHFKKSSLRQIKAAKLATEGFGKK